MEETQRQNLIMSFHNVLRTSGLVGIVDLQRVAMAFSSLVEQVPEGQNLPLGPLYDFLLEQKAPEPVVRELLVFLKSREDRLGLAMDLPPPLLALTPEECSQIVTAFSQRSAVATQAKPVVDPKAHRKTSLDTSRPEFDRRSVDPKVRTRKLASVAVVLGLILGGSLIYNSVTAPARPVPVVLNDPSGLPCLLTRGSGPTVVCHVKKAFADKTPLAEINARGAVTAAAAKGLGYKRVLVFSSEDATLRWVF